MSNTATPSLTQFLQGSPVLHVRDPSTTATFYSDILGFSLDYEDGYYFVMTRDNASIHLVKDEHEPQGVHLFHRLEDVDAYHAEVVARGANVTRSLGNQPYGLREFALHDNNGVEIVFGEEIRENTSP